jgi:hypothetical protein
LLFEGGGYVCTIPPGEKLKISANQVAIIVDDGELGLDLEVDGLHSQDHYNVTLEVQASMRLVRPEVFLANLMHGRDRFKVGDLEKVLAGEIRQSLLEMVAELNAEELHRGRVRDQLELELISRWKVSLEHCGFMLNRFRVLQFHLPGQEQAEKVLAEAGDSAVEQQAQRQGKQVLFEQELADFRLDTGILVQKGEAEIDRRQVEVDFEIRRMHQEAERLEQRQSVLERLLENETLQRMTELTSEDEWRKLQREVDRNRLLEDAEWQELRHETQAGTEKKEIERQLLLKRLRCNAQADFEELELRRRYQLKLLEMKGDTSVTEEQLKREQLRFETELTNRRTTFDAMLSESGGRFDQEELQRKAIAERQIWKIEQMETIRQMGKDREAARKLKEQVTTAEMFAAMTPDQILAMSVAQNPSQSSEIAEAFRAARAGEADERERQLYERMLDEVKSAYQQAQALDHEKFRMSVEADQRHRAARDQLDEQEKARSERIAARPHSTRVPVPEGDEWLWCDTHEIRYRSGRPCPLCARQDS